MSVLIATCVFTSAASANSRFAGKFTLPYEVHWGQAVLPAGDYWIRMDSIASPTTITPMNGSSAGVYTKFRDLADKEKGGTYLTITTRGNEHRVRSLNVPALGKSVIFVPLTRSEREELATAGQINKVPVVIAAK